MRFAFTLFLLFVRIAAFCQDPSPDLWVDTGDETQITVPASVSGRVSILKGNPNANTFNELLRIGTTHSPADFVGFRNGTFTNNFNPVLLGYNEGLTTVSTLTMADAAGNLSRYELPANTKLTSLSGTATANASPKLGADGTLSTSQLADDGTGVGMGGPPVDGAKLALYGTMRLMLDERTKTNVTRMTGALQKITGLNGYFYDWKGRQAPRDVGFLAQEVEAILPEAVFQNAGALNFSTITALFRC